MTNFTVISDQEAVELRQLREFYRCVVQLTVNHDVIEQGADTIAVVYPDQLAKALDKVNPQWVQS